MSTSSTKRVKDFLIELEYSIIDSMESDGILLIEKEEVGIKNMIIICDEPIVILEQRLFDIAPNSNEVYKRLLQKNREIIHGALVLDEHGTTVIFRDTLQLENLDLNELEGSLNSLAVLLGEMGTEIIQFSKN